MGPALLPLVILFLLLIHPASAANPNGFARLADGAIVAVEQRTPQQLTFRKADGNPGQVATDQVDGWLATRQADELVDRLLPKVGVREKHDEVRKQLATLQMAAVPRIIHHLKTGDERRRMEAIAALQFVWSTEAEEPVKAVLDDENQSIRSIALRLVQTRIPGDHTGLLDSAAANNDPHVSGPALHTLLSAKPDPRRLAEALDAPIHWRYLHSLLPRHHDRGRFGVVTHRMLDQGDAKEQASALCALIHQYDLDADTEAKVLRFLENPEPSLRMRAAEYLRWHGGGSSLPPLQAAHKEEKDLHCRAVMQAAAEAITRRGTLFARVLSDSSHDWDGDFEEASKSALANWAKGPVSTSLRIATLKLLGTRGFEPHFQYHGNNQTDPNDAGGRYLELVNRVTGYPGPAAVRAAQHRAPDAITPATPTLLPPVRDYFDPQRMSFGLFTGDHDGPFKDSYHVGDDVAFHQQHETVVAIGDGIVRHALVAAPSWGGLVIIEHRDPQTDKPFCSLYAHLGPLLCVQTGDPVRQGDMLGSLGRTYTRATGGYQSHLHFGIHLAPFDGRWITGYLPPHRFKDHDHSWTDPQPFIRERMR